jgi:hypothetical protein
MKVFTVFHVWANKEDHEDQVVIAESLDSARAGAEEWVRQKLGLGEHHPLPVSWRGSVGHRLKLPDNKGELWIHDQEVRP